MKKLAITFIGVLMIAGIVTQYYCPKCQSTDIVETIKQEPPTFQKKSMDDYKGMMATVPAVHRPLTFILICKNCGYKVEVTQ